MRITCAPDGTLVCAFSPVEVSALPDEWRLNDVPLNRIPDCCRRGLTITLPPGTPGEDTSAVRAAIRQTLGG